MLSENTEVFTKDNLDKYLQCLAKEYRRLNGKSMPAEIILVGGAAVLANYGFRDMTTDVDAVIHAASVMKDAINIVGDRYGLPNSWLNMDFVHTTSFSSKLVQYSVFYKQFFNVLNVRMISGAYLIAMKLRSGRSYKNDFSDIIGVLAEHELREEPLVMDMVERAVSDLYGNWSGFSEDAITFIKDIMQKRDFIRLYDEIRAEEQASKKVLIEFEQNYPDVLSNNNVNEILKEIKKSSESREELLKQLREK